MPKKKIHIFSLLVAVYLIPIVEHSSTKKMDYKIVGKIELSNLLDTKCLQTSVTIIYLSISDERHIKLNGFKFFPDSEKIHDFPRFVGTSCHFQVDQVSRPTGQSVLNQRITHFPQR